MRIEENNETKLMMKLPSTGRMKNMMKLVNIWMAKRQGMRWEAHRTTTGEKLEKKHKVYGVVKMFATNNESI